MADTDKKTKPIQSKQSKSCYGDLVTRPTKYITTVDRVTNRLFAGKLVRPLEDQDGRLWEVPLDGEKGNAVAMVAIDYRDLIDSGVLSDMPKLTAKHYILHDAIITLILTGNRKMTYTMIYRTMTGKVAGKITVPKEMITFIDEALILFSSRVQIKFCGKSPDGKDIEMDIDEPLITYKLGTAKINGKVVKKVVMIPDDPRFDPLLLRWARANGNEIDTRDITLLNVPGLNNGDESLQLKMCLYRRIIKMRYKFDRKKKGRYELADNERTIRYDYIYETIGIDEPDANKRRLLKDKMERCLKHWKEEGFIADYEHKKDKHAGNAYYAVRISFLKK